MDMTSRDNTRVAKCDSSVFSLQVSLFTFLLASSHASSTIIPLDCHSTLENIYSLMKTQEVSSIKDFSVLFIGLQSDCIESNPPTIHSFGPFN